MGGQGMDSGYPRQSEPAKIKNGAESSSMDTGMRRHDEGLTTATTGIKPSWTEKQQEPIFWFQSKQD
jgi:hypothetical protein